MTGPGGERPPTVLAADDDADVLELVRFTLEREGLRVITAVDGREALRLAREAKPDVCVLDGWMPFLPGWEVARTLHEEGTRIPVVMLTATVEDEREVRRMGVSVDVFMKKPFESASLRAEVQRLLDRRRPATAA